MKPKPTVALCLGPGGVGKTTTSAALGVAGALAGRRVVVLTIDPARRLADTLGLGVNLAKNPESTELESAGFGPSGLGNEAQKVDGEWPGELWATMLDPATTLTQLVTSHSANEAQAEQILQNRLYQNLATSLSGTNEYMAAERLHQLHNDPRFDEVVVDTPPSRHAFDFLDSPNQLVRFIDHKLYRTVFAPRRGPLRTINSAARIALKTLNKVVGATLVDDVIDFFGAFEGMDEGFRQRADETEQLLAGPETSYVMITAARQQAIDEAVWIQENLDRRGRKVDQLIVNRLTPISSYFEIPSGSDGPLWDNARQLQALAASELKLVETLKSSVGTTNDVTLIDEQSEPVRSTKHLTLLAQSLQTP